MLCHQGYDVWNIAIFAMKPLNNTPSCTGTKAASSSFDKRKLI
jgi:hypothetical protein